MNFTTAAKDLFISQPTLSSHIASLEKDLGVELITHGRRITLTQAGRALAEEAPGLISAHDAIVEHCQNAAQNGGTLVIARNHGTRSCNEDNFDILISAFIAQHPEVFVIDNAWDQETCFETLEAQDADCVSANFMPSPADVGNGVSFLAAPNYVHGAFCLWLDESHPLAGKQSVTWREITSLKMAFSANQRLSGANAQDLCNARGIKLQVRKTPEFGWSYMRAIKPDEVLVLDTGFIGYESLKMFPRRKLVPISGPHSECVLHIAYLPSNDNPALQTFVNFVNEQVQNPSYTREL